MKKRGQITIFIIIGILILLLIAVVFYFQQQAAQVVPKTPLVQKLGPVEAYIQSCIDTIGTDAAIKMGQSGGYIYLPKEVDAYPSAHVAEDTVGLLKVPMWYFNDKSYMPSLEEMRYQFSLYLNNSIKKCINNFQPLQNEYDIREIANPSFTVTIADENIVIETSYPLDVYTKARQEVYKVQNFSTFISVRLKKVYSLARAVFEAENRQNFLENLTLQLMTMNNDIPFSGLEFTCSKKQWSIRDIKNALSDEIASNFQSIRFDNTNYAPFSAPESEYKKFKGLKIDPNTGAILNLPKSPPPGDIYYYFHFFFDVTSENFRDLKISTIFYREWPMTLNPFPTENGRMQSQDFQGFDQINFLCMEMWHFVYDVSFPVEFAIRDDESFGGKGYIFKFAMPVIIMHNRPMKLPLSTRAFVNPSITGEPCTTLGAGQVDIRAYDKVTKEELGGANISYRCLNSACILGRTKANAGIDRLVTSLPEGCANPTLTAIKAGYLDGSAVSPDSGRVSIPMVPLKKYSFNVTKILSINGEQSDLLPDENVLIMLKNKAYNYEQYIVYPDVTGGNLSQLNLIYDTITYDTQMFISKGDRLVGGWTGNWTVSARDLAESKFVLFKVYEKIPYPSTDEETIGMIGEIANVSSSYPPVFEAK